MLKKTGSAVNSSLAVDELGMETTDPHKTKALYSMGEHRGSGLGLAIDLLCAILSNSLYGPHIPKMYGDMSEHRLLGGPVGAVKIENFINADIARSLVSGFLKELRNLPPRNSDEPVLAPGDKERKFYS